MCASGFAKRKRGLQPRTHRVPSGAMKYPLGEWVTRQGSSSAVMNMYITYLRPAAVLRTPWVRWSQPCGVLIGAGPRPFFTSLMV
jgi:hypothetical protein